MHESLQWLVESAALPIRADAPTGDSLAGNGQYLALRAEMDKAGTLSEVRPDWEKIVNLGIELLATRSKDLQVACFVAYGLLRTHQLEGLAAGLEALTCFLERFWESAYPPLRRFPARVNAIAWLYEQVDANLLERTGEVAERGLLTRSLAQIEAQRAFLEPILEEEDVDPRERPKIAAVQRLLNGMLERSAPASPLHEALPTDAGAGQGGEPPAECGREESTSSGFGSAFGGAASEGGSSGAAEASAGLATMEAATDQARTQTSPDGGNAARDVAGSMAAGQTAAAGKADTGAPAGGAREAGEATTASAASSPTRLEAPATTAGADGPADVNNEATRELRKVLDRCTALMPALRAQRPTSPWPYVLPRVAEWIRFEELRIPADGRTNIPEPPATERRQLELFAASGNFAAQLGLAETLFVRFPLWLDLQRHTVSALQALGPAYALPRVVVLDQIRTLVQRHPGLDTLQFQKGMPCADEATRQWLNTQVRNAGESLRLSGSVQVDTGAGIGLGGGSCALGACAAWDEALQAARSLISIGQPEGAWRALAGPLAALGSERERFRAKVELAALCLQAGQARAALPMLDALEEVADRHDLARWDPEEMADLLRVYVKCQRAVMNSEKSPTAASQETLKRLIRRLGHLDVFFLIQLDS